MSCINVTPTIAFPCIYVDSTIIPITHYMVAKAIERMGGIPKIFHCEPLLSDRETALLGGEVEQLIAQIDTENRSIQSRLIELFDRVKPQSIIARIIRIAKMLLNNVDGLLLPGGYWDIEPLFYGERWDPRAIQPANYKRSMLELALFKRANDIGLPVLGICRWSQFGNVYYGGSLNQHVEGQRGVIQTYETTKTVGILAQILKNPITGWSEHHQCYRTISPELELICVTKSGIGKALEKKFGAPQIFVQWHPEFIFIDEAVNGTPVVRDALYARYAHLLGDDTLSEDNKKIFAVLIQCARVKKLHKQLLLSI